jgi:hypothetical protein
MKAVRFFRNHQIMKKLNAIPWLLIAGLVIAAVLMMQQTREKFAAEFIDKTQDKRTISVEDSSYAQVTNHAVPRHYSMGPIEGIQTPFQVNQYKAYVK